MNYIKIPPLYSYHGKGNKLWRQKTFFCISALKLAILTWALMENCLLLEPASSGQLENCRFLHFLFGFSADVRRLPLGYDLSPDMQKII